MTIERGVFDVIKKANEPIGAAVIAKRLRAERSSVANALGHLGRKGWIKRTGPPSTARYVIARYGEPTDLRGTAQASQIALREHGPSRKRPQERAQKPGIPKPIATTALEQSWGWLP
jgi:hypothetical protein